MEKGSLQVLLGILEFVAQCFNEVDGLRASVSRDPDDSYWAMDVWIEGAGFTRRIEREGEADAQTVRVE